MESACACWMFWPSFGGLGRVYQLAAHLISFGRLYPHIQLHHLEEKALCSCGMLWNWNRSLQAVSTSFNSKYFSEAFENSVMIRFANWLNTQAVMSGQSNCHGLSWSGKQEDQLSVPNSSSCRNFCLGFMENAMKRQGNCFPKTSACTFSNLDIQYAREFTFRFGW